MLKKRLVAILVGLALLVMGVVRPAPARADAAEALGIALIAAGSWVLLVFVGTWAAFGPPWASWDERPTADMNGVAAQPAIRFGPRCAPVPGSPQPLACW